MSFHPQSRAVLITCRCGFLGIALDARGERREIKVLLELELVIEYFADRCRDVDLVLVEESLQGRSCQDWCTASRDDKSCRGQIRVWCGHAGSIRQVRARGSSRCCTAH